MLVLHEPQLDSLDEEFVLEALRSSWVSTGGPFVTRFEKEFAEYVGSKHAVSVCNGTIGLFLCLEILKRNLKIDRNFEVIVPTLSFIATANAVFHAGGSPVFVDSSPHSLNIDIDHLQKIVKENYKIYNGSLINKFNGKTLLAVMPVHLMGWKSDIDSIKKILSDFCENIPVIEDAAEALGVFDLKGNHIGKEGLASVFSFNGNKILTTGSGGMIVTDDDNFAQLAKHLSTTAKVDNLRYIHDQIGFNFRMNNILASLGCAQLKKIEFNRSKKKKNFELYSKSIKNEKLLLYKEGNLETNNWLINAVFKSYDDREKCLENLIRNDIQVRPLWTPCHLQPAFQLECVKNEFPNADRWWKTVLSLPSSATLNPSDIQNISSIINASW